MTFEDRAYQDDAVDRACTSIDEHGGYALLMEQRTGKTHPSLTIAKRRQPERLLIVCPLIAVENIWGANVPLYGLKAEVRIITWKSLWSERKRLKKWKPDMIIADELHNAKDRGSKQSRALRMVARHLRRDGTKKWQCAARLGLTGTPQESGLEDYWAQFDFVDDELFGDWDNFKARYCKMGGWFNKKIMSYRNQDEFQKLLESRSYRVLLEDVKPVKTDLPPEHIVRFDLVESRATYASMEQKFIAELNRMVRVRELQADGSYKFVRRRKRVVAARVITQAMKLHQLSSGFIMDEEKNVHHIGDEKLLHAGALMLALGDVPQVYFVRFLHELTRLGTLFKFLGREVTYISGKHKSYVSGTPFDIAIVQVQSGVAIDLAHAEEAIMYSWNYSHLTHEQARFRIRGYHATRARYHYLVANGTIDEPLLATVVHKLSFATLILNTYRRKHKLVLAASTPIPNTPRRKR